MNRFGIKIFSWVGGDKSADFRIVITCFEVVKSSFCIVIIASVTNRVDWTDTVSIKCNCMVTPSVIKVFCEYYVLLINNFCDITKDVFDVIVWRSVVDETDKTVNSVNVIKYSVIFSWSLLITNNRSFWTYNLSVVNLSVPIIYVHRRNLIRFVIL